MTKKEVLEIRKQFGPENVSISRICGCYVDGEKNIRTRMKEAFLSLPEEECFKYYEIFKKSLSGTIGKNLINMEFPMEQEKEGGTQEFLLKLRNSGLKDDNLITEFFERIIDSYRIGESYYIILIHAVYDIPGKSSEGSAMFDASDEVYDHILCSICPVKLSKAGLGYNAENNNIEDIQGDWLVAMPAHGFLFPAFNDCGSDIHNLLFYTKKPDELQEEFVNKFLGCCPPCSSTKQTEVFQAAMKEALGTDGNLEHVMDFQEKLSEWEEEHREKTEISKDELGRILEECGANEEQVDTFKENLTTEENGQFLISAIKKYPESFFDIPEEFILFIEQVYKEKTRVLTFESILELYKAGYKEAAEAELIYKYGKFVYYIMGKYFPTYKDRYKEDLFQCGCIGILNAIENYRPGTSFTTYSQYYIRHEMIVFTHFITNTPSRHYAELQKKINAAISECECLGLDESDQNISILTGLSLRIVQQEKQIQETKNLIYLDAMENPEAICGCNADSPESVFIKQECIQSISQSLLKLKPLTLKIMIFHIFENYSLSCIAKYLNLQTWKVRDLYYNGLKILRKDSRLKDLYE